MKTFTEVEKLLPKTLIENISGWLETRMEICVFMKKSQRKM
jgi:hypothetical protein